MPNAEIGQEAVGQQGETLRPAGGPSAILKSAASGIVIAATGALAIWEGMQYPLGSLTGIGPGFLPVAVGVVLILLGAAVSVEARFVRGEENVETPKPSLRAVAAIFGGILVFSLLLNRLGVVPATFALVFISSCARPAARPLTTLILAVVLSVVAMVVFVHGLGVPIRAFRW